MRNLIEKREEEVFVDGAKKKQMRMGFIDIYVFASILYIGIVLYMPIYNLIS